MVPEKEACVQMDYADNWMPKYRDEISSTYYDKDQITVHPMVVHYREGGSLKAKSYAGITSDGSLGLGLVKVWGFVYWKNVICQKDMP